MPDLTNEVILVTGANRGQGRAIAEHLVSLGAKVVIGARDLKQAKDVLSSMEANSTLPIELDVTKESHWKEAMKTIIKEYGKIDALVNNAGTLTRKPFTEITMEDYQHMINVNQLGVFMGMQSVIPYMEKQRKGSIINNVSISAFAPIGHSSAYAATKSAVVAMSKSAAIEVGKKGIRINMIHPGGIETDMATQGKGVPEFYNSIPLGRIGQPLEIAKAVAFLASNESSYCTGAELVVDGGMTLGTNDE